MVSLRMMPLRTIPTRLSKVLLSYVVSMETDGSIRNSLKGPRSAFRPSSIDPALLEFARQFLESFQFDMRIRQILYPEKMENALSKHSYYVLGNEQRFEPGYLICIKDKPIVFLNARLTYGFTVRMRIHSSLYEEGTIFIGTLDTVHGSLRIEDIMLYAGKALVLQPYSKRYSVLREFYANAFVQDTALAGMTVFLAEPKPLGTFRDAVESNQFHSIDLIPEQGGRRRWHVPLHAYQQQQLPKKPTATELLAYNLSTLPVSVSSTATGKAIAKRVPGLPDTFDLFTKGESIGRAAVQNAEISMKMRSSTAKEISVQIEWDEEFNRYKIIGVN